MNRLATTVLLLGASALGATSAFSSTQAHQVSQTSGGATGLGAEQISPNGEWLVYRHERVPLPGVYELWSARRGAGASRVRLSEALGSGYNVEQVSITPDSLRVIYTLKTPAGLQLWSVPMGGPSAAATLLTPPLIAGGEVLDFTLTPDGSHVIFYGEVNTIDINEVWSVPVDGPSAAATRLSIVPVGGTAEVSDYQVSPDSSRVVIRGDLDVAGLQELWSVPVTGPAAAGIKLHPNLSGGRSVTQFEISPNSSRVVIRGDMVTDGDVVLQSVPLLGPAAALVTLSLSSTPNGDVSGFDISPDSQRVIYRGDLLVDERRQLWSVPIAGPANSSVRLGPTPPSGGNLNTRVAISPDSAWVGFSGDNLVDGVEEVWLSPIAGPSGSAVVVTPTHANTFASQSRPVFSPDSSRLIFLGDYTGGGAQEVWSAGVADPARSAITLSGTVAAGRVITTFELSRDGSRVVFRGDLSFQNRYWLYSTPTDGSGPRTTLTNFTVGPVGANVEDDWRISNNSQWVVYRADSTVDERFDLRRVAIGGGSGTLLHTAVQADRDVTSLAITPDSAGVFYLVEGTAQDLWIADQWVFAADFEEGDAGEWSAQVP